MKTTPTQLDNQINSLTQELQITRNILDTILDPVFVKNADFIYTYCNTAFENYIGMPKEKIINSSVFEVASKELAEIYHAADCKLKASMKPQVYEAKVKYSDGNLHDVVFHKTPIIQDAQFVGITGIIFDITNKKKNEKLISDYIESLKESEEKFSIAFYKSPYAKLLTRVSDGKIIDVNEMFCQYSGFSYEEALNKTTFELNLWANFETRNYVISTLERGDSIHNLEMQFRKKNNEIRTALLSADLISLKNELLLLTSITDITQMKQTELALQESNAFYKLITDHSNDWEVFRDKNKKLIYCSSGIERILGYTVEEYFNDLKFSEIIHPDDIKGALTALLKVVEGQNVAPHTFRMIKKNKEIIWVEASGQPVFSESGELIGGRTSTRDISKLKESEDKFSVAFFKSPYAKLLTRASDGKIILVNDMFCEYTGYSKEEVIDKTTVELKIWVDNNLRDHLFTTLYSGSSVNHLEMQFRKKNNEIRTGLLSTGEINIGNEKVFLTSALDITEIKKTEIALEENKALYKLISDYSTNWETYINKNNELIYCSPFVENILGYTVEEYLANLKHFDWVHPEDYARIISAVNKILSGESIPIQVYRAVKKNKELIWVETSGQPVFSEKSELLGARFSTRDITQLKEAQSALLEKEEKILLLMNSTAEGILGLDLNGNCTFANKASIALLGYQSEEDLLGKNLHSLIHHSFSNGMPMKEEFCRISKTYNDGIEITEEGEVFWRKDQTSFPVHYYSYPQYKGSEIIGAVLAFFDISEKKLRDQELAEYTTELKDLNATKDKFFSIIAHDLKSPFQGLMGYSEILMEEYDTLSDGEKKEFINNIGELSKSAYKLLDNLLTWSRMQRGTMPFEPQNIILLEDLLPTISLLKQTALNKQILVEYLIDDSISVYADSEMLSTIVRNLVSNSIKFTNPTGKIYISAKRLENYIQISISDTGVGMTKEVVEKIFDLTSNTSTKGTANESGTGLGLVLCKEMVDIHGGTISVESEVGKGTAFHFTIPNKI